MSTNEPSAKLMRQLRDAGQAYVRKHSRTRITRYKHSATISFPKKDYYMIGVLTSPALKQYFDKIIEKKVFKNLAELSYEVSQHNLVIFIRNRGI